MIQRSAADGFIGQAVVACDDDPALPRVLPGHGVTPDDALAAFHISFDGENEILDDGDVAVDADVNGAQFADDDLGGFRPEADPFVQPRAVDVDRAFVAETEEILMDIFQKFIYAFVNQMV